MSQFKNLTPAEVLERSENIPSVSIIGGSGSGKTTTANNQMNSKIALYTSIGIGEKNQTTNIPSNIILDSRIIRDEDFAILIRKKDLDKKLILQKILKAVVDEFLDNDYDVEETVENMKDEKWANKFLEPKDASYHLKLIKDNLNIKKLNESIKELLEQFNLEEFKEKVSERKKVLGKKAPKLKTLKKMVFTEYVLDPNLNNSIIKWIENIEYIIIDKLKKVFKVENPFISSFSHTVEGIGKDILIELYNPQQPYSLVIDYIDIASRPREEAIKIMEKKDSNISLRMKLVDTIGVSQEGIDEDSLTIGMDRSLSRSVNGII
ncbi:hypothetical protein [Clostridium haemolyticum]|uniref:Uncharacterized protein n=1 Tax=Clostridium haemolyticum NCTC 9693 TaxID=1443114 RepID=A0ABR4TFW3_CLOHA|nr:hypothetical protein [Clostridium haemolyticum]KEI16745.1 hypothetical protein Z960_08355 [Clostridium haemolyticum NCTC 9693]KGN04691.1 hypothetical protein Z961_01445 [Clostridium haemolyticum NCTC 8350]